jgi:hypothetical protein
MGFEVWNAQRMASDRRSGTGCIGQISSQIPTELEMQVPFNVSLPQVSCTLSSAEERPINLFQTSSSDAQQKKILRHPVRASDTIISTIAGRSEFVDKC